MARKNSPLGFVVALFDVLGFEYRLKTFGLDEMLNRYLSIVELVKKNSERNRNLEKLNFDSPFWLAGTQPAIAVFYNIEAVYSSDSILLWSNLAWKRVQNQPIEILKRNENHPAYGYFSKPVPLMPFLTMCAEIICKSIEIDLPLRGAIAMGDAVLNQKDQIFLGEPIVDTARLEKEQNCIGLSVCNSFIEQGDLKRLFLPYSKQFKGNCSGLGKNLALNWPMYWRDYRRSDLKLTIEELLKKNNGHPYYSNTLEFIKYSENYKY